MIKLSPPATLPPLNSVGIALFLRDRCICIIPACEWRKKMAFSGKGQGKRTCLDFAKRYDSTAAIIRCFCAAAQFPLETSQSLQWKKKEKALLQFLSCGTWYEWAPILLGMTCASSAKQLTAAAGKRVHLHVRLYLPEAVAVWPPSCKSLRGM